jgi:hypothetical protein
MEENSTKWSVDFLKSMSFLTDPYAEGIINDIALGDDFSHLRELFATLNDNNDITSGKDLNPAVYDYFNSNMELPEWADSDKIKIAQEVYSRFGPQVSLVLNFNALPLCYTCKNGAKVLAATGRLTGANKDVGRTFRRLFETSRIVMDVLSPGGLDPNGSGIITAKKVRLYHAAIRYFLMNKKYNPEGWDDLEFGEPINQEEMAGTLMSFSALVINGLEQLGSRLTEEEKDAYMHCWIIAGHFLGLRPELYPNSYKEGWDLGIAIIKRNNHESNDSKILTKALLDFSTHLFRKTVFSKIVLKNMPYYLIGFFVNNISDQINVDLTKQLGINKKLSPFAKFRGKVFISILRTVTILESKSRFFRIIYSKISMKFLKSMTDFYLKMYNADFYIPSSLKASWRMK